VSVTVDYDPEEDFSTYKTFGWLPERPPPTGDPRLDSPLIDSRVRRAVDSTLTARGFRKILDGTPDFWVTYHTGVEQKLDVYTMNRGYVNRWGYTVSVPETRVSQYDEGTLVLDIADARERELVWRGVAQGRLRSQPTPDQTTAAVNEAVAELLKQFPPGS